MTDERTQAEIDEVRRDRIVWTTLIVLGVVVSAGVMFLGWGIVEGRLEAAKKLDKALEILKTTDPTMAAVDEIVRSATGPEVETRARAITPRIGTARAQLVEANRLAGAGLERLTDDEQEQARLTQAAAMARVDALDAALVVVSARAGGAAAGGAGDSSVSAYLGAKQKSVEADDALRTN